MEDQHKYCSVLWLQQPLTTHSSESHLFLVNTATATTNCSCLSLRGCRTEELPGHQLLEIHTCRVWGQHSGKTRNGMLLRFYLDTKTWARKQIPALGDEGRRKGSSICWVSDCQLVRFQLQHTVSQEDRTRLLPNTALQKKGHSVRYLVIFTWKTLFCLRFVSVVILYADI